MPVRLSRKTMDHTEIDIVVLDADEAACRSLCGLLKNQHYTVKPVYSLQDLEKYMQQTAARVLIHDLDTLPVEIKTFRKLKRLNPSMVIMGLSNRSFHPELAEAMTRHIFACLKKPIDEEELIFWIRSLF